MVESGTFYGTLVDPLLKRLRTKISLEIDPGESVIDIACGTGAQLFSLAQKAGSVTGIDLSESMIRYANKSAAKNGFGNAEFMIADATDLSAFYGQKFDAAILSLALHQFHPDLYKIILNEIVKISGRLILLDYAVPLPRNLAGTGSRIAEFLAGREHFKNFRHYYRLGGLQHILPENRFSTLKSSLHGKGAFQLVVARRTEATGQPVQN